ncbi:Protein of unknown function [Duganella sp. CF402]|uniref:DUF1653 domain-containing protein n=1 Tax=unclassified Duganella TaxID=2636909 RepID=UPI0008ABA95F|nr:MULTISPECIES: DUF1653 domain-containing protein [unclassified Duganella]RZT09085.1 uncharacterized protein DUF1653 [Duganella sp. BK701]SEL71001.1 Protein of unknown function [Duganella sp. CF402]
MRYQHYKGGIYELVCEATLESDLSTMIVYRAANGSIWCRPREVFFEMIEVDGQQVQRFKPIDAVN